MIRMYKNIDVALTDVVRILTGNANRWKTLERMKKSYINNDDVTIV